MSRELQSDKIDLFVKALIKAQALIDHATMDAENPHYESEFASLEAVINVSKKPLLENGIAVVQLPFLDGDGRSMLITTFLHESGQWMRSYTPIFLEKQTYQSLGSGISYMRRYSLAAFLNIGQKDDDGEAANSQQGEDVGASPGAAAVSNQSAPKLPVLKYPFPYPDGFKGSDINKMDSAALVACESNLINWKNGKNKSSYPANGDKVLAALQARLPENNRVRA